MLLAPLTSPSGHTKLKLAKSVTQGSDGNEEGQIHGGSDDWLPQAGRGGHSDQGGLPRRWLQRCTFYKWRAKFDGMEASEAQRLGELEAENAKLKNLLAESI
jgi:hypothetical protein